MNRNGLERPDREGDIPVRASGDSRGDHPARLNTTGRPIVDQYREGKVGSTPSRGVKENLKPSVYKRLELRSDSVPFA